MVWNRHNIALIPISLFFIFLLSCEPEVEKPAEGNFTLSFSADTILFDTIFTETRSITKRLKVYNNSSGAIVIPAISLKEGSSSPFSLIINGIKGKSFDQVKLLGKDSLLILVESQIEYGNENLPFVVEDELLFSHSETDGVPIIAWGQDAIFLKDTILACNTTFSSQKPYLLYGIVLVDSLCTLTVDPGAKIYSHFNSGIFIEGSLKINGTPENRVLFTNDRLDKNYKNAPGQWRGIYFLEGSNDHQIMFADIRNSEVGVRIGKPDEDNDYDIEIGHTRIENMSTYGVLSFTSDVYIHNSLINNCGISSLAGVAGGTYRLWNNTFANYSFDFFREDATLILSDNLVLADNSLLVGDLAADIQNNIIWGSLQDEVVISNTEGSGAFYINFNKNLIRTSSDSLAARNIINTDPEFIAPEKYMYQLDSSSSAVNAGKILPGINTDLEGKPRINAPDLGAFENQ